MSRSKKKHPIGPICGVGKGATMRKAKREANRRFRRYFNSMKEWASGNAFKRFEERWSWPDDGKAWYDDVPKSYRK